VFSGACAAEIDNLDSVAAGCPGYPTIDDVGQLGTYVRFLVGGRAVPATGYVYYGEPAYIAFAAGMIERSPEAVVIITDLGKPDLVKRLENMRGKYTKHAADLAPRYNITGYDVEGASLGTTGLLFFGKHCDQVGEHFQFLLEMYNTHGVGKFYWVEADYTEEGAY